MPSFNENPLPDHMPVLKSVHASLGFNQDTQTSSHMERLYLSTAIPTLDIRGVEIDDIGIFPGKRA